MRRLYAVACALALPFSIRAQAVNLGTAASFGVLGATTVTNTGPTFIDGDLGVRPGTAITGFPPGSQSVSSSLHIADAVALQAHADAQIAYGVAAGLAPSSLLSGTNLGGLSLTPGVYFFSSSSQLTGALTLNAQGDTSARFVFQIGSTLITASNSVVSLINGAQACNVIWQVGSSATLGTGTDFIGTILAHTSISANSGVSVSGSLIALNGAVTLNDNTIEVVDTCGSSTTTTTASTSSTRSIPILNQAQESVNAVPGSISATSTTGLPSSTALLSPTSSSLFPTSSLSAISANGASAISGQTALINQAVDTSSLPASASTSLRNLQINSLAVLATATAPSSALVSSSSITSMTSQSSTLASLSNNATTTAQSSALGSLSNATNTTNTTAQSSALGSASNSTSTNSSSASNSGAEYTISSISDQSEFSFLAFTTITTTKCVTLTKFLFEESCTCYKSHLETITETFTVVVPCSTQVGIPPSSLGEEVVEPIVVSRTASILNQASNVLVVTSSCTSLETLSTMTQSGAARSRDTTESLSTSSPTTSTAFTGPGNRLTVVVNYISYGVIGIALLVF